MTSYVLGDDFILIISSHWQASSGPRKESFARQGGTEDGHARFPGGFVRPSLPRSEHLQQGKHAGFLLDSAFNGILRGANSIAAGREAG